MNPLSNIVNKIINKPKVFKSKKVRVCYCGEVHHNISPCCCDEHLNEWIEKTNKKK